ncbi:hypothetical protein ACFQ9V_11145 [Leifsonia sp. NPDC056665]|uniref:hypothetical protein n=1 Tax=Leifsonia sp. NPDC056665 TaxID=3345901 RepID=UPI00368B37BF
MKRIWVDLIREERENPERGRERWCGECALWRLAAGAGETEGETEGEGEMGADSEDSPASTPIIPGDAR